MSRASRPSFVTLPREARAPATVLDFLDRRFPHVGRAAWESRIRRGLVAFDSGAPVTVEEAFRPGARLRYFREVEAEPEIPLSEEILHRDEHLLVVDKPHFLPVVPGGPYVNECLLYRVQKKCALEELRAVHRLDRDTAGLVLLATSARAAARYGALFLRGAVVKEYLAIAHLPDDPGRREWEVINRLVPGDPWFRMREVSGVPNAATRIELIEGPRRGLGLFRLRPRTGKKHQLRLHMASLGFPILGDRYYPRLQEERPPDFSRPLRLLAERLSFRDPQNGEDRSFRSRARFVLDSKIEAAEEKVANGFPSLPGS